MRTLITMIMAMAATATQVLAAEGGADEGMGLLAKALIAFGAMIVVFQFIPCIMLLGGMLKGVAALFDKMPGKVTAGDNK